MKSIFKRGIRSWGRWVAVVAGISVGGLAMADETPRPDPPKVAYAPKYTTIDEAIARGDIDDVKRHVATDPERVHQGKNPKMTPLQQAILRNKTDIAVFLVEAGADVNQRDSSARTPLHLAVERGNAALIPVLIEHKGDPNLLDKTGWTPLHWAAAKNNVAVAKALLDGGADVKKLSARGGTALHEAAASGGKEIILLLLKHKVDPTVVSKTGVTALDVAKKMKNEPAIKVLGAL